MKTIDNKTQDSDRKFIRNLSTQYLDAVRVGNGEKAGKLIEEIEYEVKAYEIKYNKRFSLLRKRRRNF